jgi:chromosome segregation ATPase
MHAHQAQLEEEIRVLKAKNTEMEQQLRGYDNANADGQEIASIRSESEKYKEEADSLRYQLSASQADATDASKLAEELHAAQNTSTEELQRKESELREAQRELKLAAERASEELEVAMEAKTAELMDLREKIEKSEAENQSFSRLVDELSEAGQVSCCDAFMMNRTDAQATIALYESEKFKLDDKIRTLEEKLAKVREERDQAQELAAQRPPSPSSRAKAAVSAAEIDNETLNAQVKHLQNKINNLEEELDERRAELESEAESWNQKVQKGREAEKIQVELVKSLRGEIGDYKSQATSAKNRIGELEGALKETQVALEGARAEIETLRVEAAVCHLGSR